VCCSVLQCVAVCCSVLQCVAVCCSVLQCVAVCCSVLHRGVVAFNCQVCVEKSRCRRIQLYFCCSVLQCFVLGCMTVVLSYGVASVSRID